MWFRGGNGGTEWLVKVLTRMRQQLDVVTATPNYEGAPHCIGVGQQELNPCTTCEPMMDCLREMTVLGADRADTVHCDNDGPLPSGCLLKLRWVTGPVLGV